MSLVIEKISNDKIRIYDSLVAATCSGTFIPGEMIIDADAVLDMFNQIVPMEIREPFINGNPDCTHAWRPWKFNDKFMICAKCPAMQKIKRLVPKSYE